jgi:replicative DNA helicase
VKAIFQTAADVWHSWRDALLSGQAPTLFPLGVGELGGIEIGPGLVTLIGGAPGAGKTAFTMQALFDALRLTPNLKAVVCNIEMALPVLLDRQLARLSGVDLTTIRYRRLTGDHTARINAALATLEPLFERLAFVRPPFALDNVAATADEFGADLLLLDYIQRIPPPGEHGDKRGAVNATMDYLRKFADAGVAVIVVSAVGRQRDAKGRATYAGDLLNMASFRESSELEFGADDAFIIAPDQESEDVILRHLKSRHGECRDIRLRFDRKFQRFDSTDHIPSSGKLQTALDTLWGETPDAESKGEQ